MKPKVAEGAATAGRPARAALTGRQALHRRPARGDAGFTLVELLIVLIIMPIIVGAIADAVITSLKDQSGISGRLSDSSSAQTTSAFYVRDVQSAAYVTTNGGTASPAACGSGTTFMLGLTWGSPTAGGTVVSYWENPETPGSPTSLQKLIRLFCTGGSNTPVSSVTVAHGLASSAGIRSAVAPAGKSAAAATDWAPTLGVSAVALGALESSSIFNFDLVAAPRQSEQVSGGGNPAPPPLLLLGSGPSIIGCVGNYAVNVNGAAYLDSTANGAGNLGPNTTLTATQIYTADPSPSSAITGGTYTPDPPTYAPTVADPFATLTPPAATGLPIFTDGTNHGPGVYTTTLNFAGNSASVLATGTYILEQGISVTGGASLASGPGGVLLYVTGGSVNFSGGGNVSLAPLAPPYYPSPPNPQGAQNLGIWQAASDTNPLTLSGNGSANTYSGTIYAPGAQVTSGGNAGYTAGAVEAASLSCGGSGHGTITIG